jgi:hypothetical protein
VDLLDQLHAEVIDALHETLDQLRLHVRDADLRLVQNSLNVTHLDEGQQRIAFISKRNLIGITAPKWDRSGEPYNTLPRALLI